MDSMDDVLERLDQIYAELGEIKRYLILNRPPRPVDDDVWAEFLALSDEVSALWTGPGAVEEIRSQRDK
jgi:hypothetical protein